MRTWSTGSVAATQALGVDLANELIPNGTLLLTGPLGAGKTVLAQGVARGMGIDPLEVLSPTFTLIREHAGAGGSLSHIDLYRLEGAELESIGLDEILVDSGVKVIEWGERWPLRVCNSLWLEIRVGNEPVQRVITESSNTLAAIRS